MTAETSAGAAKPDSAAALLRAWFTGRLPGDWFTGPPRVSADREEITVIGTLPDPAGPVPAEGGPAGGGPAEGGPAEGGPAGDAAAAAAAADGRARRFREQTREHRIAIAREAEHEFGRKVSWGVEIGGRTVMFTTFSVPVMTRLRQAERQVLDTLVDAGVARSRSDALAWCVRLVGANSQPWLADLRAALSTVQQVRAAGPDI